MLSSCRRVASVTNAARWGCAVQPTLQKRFQGGFTPSDMPIIKNKWAAAEKVGQICESMKNVAAGALPANEKHLSNARPFGQVSSGLFELEEEPSDPEAVKKVLHIAVGTERGMCGAIAASTVRAIEREVRREEEREHVVVTLGKRSASVGNTFFGKDQLMCFGDVKTKVVTWDTCCFIAEYCLQEVEDWDKLKIHFNMFENAVRFYMSSATIYKAELTEAIASVQLVAYEVEADEETFQTSLMEFKLASMLYWYLAENVASENGARLQSMDGAARNCEEMCTEYEKIYQGLRKTKITNSLIIAAAASKMADM